MSLPKYLEDACEEIDASIFSSDVILYDVDNLKAFEEYLGRWTRVIAQHKQIMLEDEEHE